MKEELSVFAHNQLGQCVKLDYDAQTVSSKLQRFTQRLQTITVQRQGGEGAPAMQH